jgi:hypothetical protein
VELIASDTQHFLREREFARSAPEDAGEFIQPCVGAVRACLVAVGRRGRALGGRDTALFRGALTCRCARQAQLSDSLRSASWSLASATRSQASAARSRTSALRSRIRAYSSRRAAVIMRSLVTRALTAAVMPRWRVAASRSKRDVSCAWSEAGDAELWLRSQCGRLIAIGCELIAIGQRLIDPRHAPVCVGRGLVCGGLRLLELGADRRAVGRCRQFAIALRLGGLCRSSSLVATESAFALCGHRHPRSRREVDFGSQPTLPALGPVARCPPKRCYPLSRRAC